MVRVLRAVVVTGSPSHRGDRSPTARRHLFPSSIEIIREREVKAMREVRVGKVPKEVRLIKVGKQVRLIKVPKKGKAVKLGKEAG